MVVTYSTWISLAERGTEYSMRLYPGRYQASHPKSRPGNQDRQGERRSTPQVLIGMAWDPSPSRSIALSAQMS
jgi:hypothetical protein